MTDYFTNPFDDQVVPFNPYNKFVILHVGKHFLESSIFNRSFNNCLSLRVRNVSNLLLITLLMFQ